ncbi:MAG: BamA/TamA family outer membrane protein [Pseudomonadota bacterium]
MRDDRFGLLSFPLQFKRDTSNDLLDPISGGRLSLRLIPYYETFGTKERFLKNYASYSHYFQLAEKPFLTLAGRSALGVIFGADRDRIAADERFYAGGGGSIRGYEYQSVGPLRKNEPIGGRSLFELSVELRVKVTNNFGLVTFCDGGSAFSSVIPDWGETLRWGAGLGLRYYTRIGPLRFDVGFPLNRREKIDDPFQFYVSIGQAF